MRANPLAGSFRDMGFFAYLGIAVFAYYALSFVSVLLKTMVLSGPKITKKYGEWAVVTGATDGVGKAMCFELARKGCRCARAACAPPATVLTAAWPVAALRSVLLVSRSEQKLKAVKGELTDKYPSVAVDYAVADFSKLTPALLKTLKSKLQDIDVGLLVNNVGISYDFCQWFHELSDTEVASP